MKWQTWFTKYSVISTKEDNNMIQRDIIKDQLEQLSRVLASILGKMIGIDGGPDPALIVSMKAEIEQELNLDLDELVLLDDVALLLELEHRHFASQQYFLLARVIETLADKSTEQERQQTLLQKALLLAQESLDTSDIYDFEKVECYALLEEKVNKFSN